METHTFQEVPSVKNMMCQHQHCIDGKKKDLLKQLDYQVEVENTEQETSMPYSKTPKQTKKRKSQSVMLESLQPIKKKICKDKLNSSEINTPTTKSSKTLDQDSTGKGKVSVPFWNKYTKALSKKLWLPTKTDCVDLDSNWWNGSLKNLGQNSWFSVKQSVMKKTTQENSQKIYSQLQQSLWQEIMDSEQAKTEKEEKKLKTTKITKESKQLKVRKIRLYPTKKQREILKQWFGTFRWTYNKCLEGIKNGMAKNKKELRAKYLNSINFKDNEELKWVLETPYDVRDEAMRDLLKAYKSNFASKREKFDIKFKSKKMRTQSIVIHNKHWKNGTFHPTFFGKDPIRGSEPLPEKLGFDCRLQMDNLQEFYLCLIIPIEIRSDSQRPDFDERTKKMIALDPGVRTFMTGYDPNNRCIKWGKSDIGRIYRLCYVLDDLQSRWAKTKANKRYQMKKAGKRIRKKIRSLVDEIHKKLSKWLCEEYNIILLPIFETQKMTIKNKRKIRSKTARAMLTWSHYRFQQRLINKSREYPWCKIIICDEQYTSKTCGSCGHIKTNLGGSKVYRCNQCNIDLDRDMNGARNILLRYLTLNKIEQSGKSDCVGSYPLHSMNDAKIE